jgi:UrcA family protein
MHVNTRILMIMGLSASLFPFAVIATPAIGDALEAKVAIGDVDSTTAAGQARIEHRIDLAARKVCAPFEGRSVRQRQAWRTCVDQAAERARSTVEQRLAATRTAQRVASCESSAPSEIRTALDAVR